MYDNVCEELSIGREDEFEEFSRVLCIVSNWSCAQDHTDAKWQIFTEFCQIPGLSITVLHFVISCNY